MRYIVVPLRALDAEAVPPGTPRRHGGAGMPHAPSGERAAAPEGAEPAPAPDASDAAAGPADAPGDPLGHWVAVARQCLDACLVLDAEGSVVAVSATAAEMLGRAPDAFVGRPLEEAISLVDFTDLALEARGAERRIPPLIALRENALSRGVIRVRRPDGHRLMLDAVAAPIHDGDSRPVGAVSFLASV